MGLTKVLFDISYKSNIKMYLKINNNNVKLKAEYGFSLFSYGASFWASALCSKGE
jgi:hypothetical protein